MKKLVLTTLGFCAAFAAANAQSFTSGNLVVLQTTGSVSKAASAITLKEFTTSGTAGISVSLPATGTNAIQTSGVYGGSEGFLTTSTDNKYLVVAGYNTAAAVTDITGTTSATVPRVVGTIAPSGFYLQVASSNTFYSANDIRGAVSDGTNYWAAGAANAGVDGIDYFGPSTPAALAGGTTPPKPYAIRIFNGQIYYSTQKAGPTSTSSQLGVFALGTGMPTSGTVTVSALTSTGSTAITPEDFSINATGDVCYVCINVNSATGGIYKYTKSGSTWSASPAYILGTGATNVGAYGVVVDYSGSVPVLYATTSEAAGNRVIKIVDNGSAATATISTLVAATAGTFYKGITFAPTASGTPIVNLTVSQDTASEAGASVITVKANASSAVSTAQSLSLNISGSGITSGDYTLSSTTINIPAGATTGSVTFTVKDDILGEGTEIAKLTMRSPSSGILFGIDSAKTITIADNDGNNIPTIKFNTDSTTNFIDAGLSVAPASPFAASGVINDLTDPASTLGITFTVHDLETPDTSLIVTVSTSDTTIVPFANITLTGKDSSRNVKIMPKAVGFATIKIQVSDGIDSSVYTIQYGASKDSILPVKSRWHTGMSDASDAIALDDDYYISGDDELNVLNVYSRKASGMPLVSYEYTSNLALPTPSKPEVDLEAGTPSPVNSGRIYWMGSMSNGKSPFDAKPNRDRIFATKVSGTGAATSFSFVGYTALKASILSWGDAYGYSFTASAAAGVDSKLPNGFAAEAMVFGPDTTTLYIGLRAPLVPLTARKNALIVPIKNFEKWFNNGTPTGALLFDKPIELNLGGRGLRDMIRLSNGTYIIIAGNVGGSPLTGAIYKWTGHATDTPIRVACAVGDTLNMEGVMQIGTGSALSLSNLQVITDNGDDVLYNDGTASKDFNSLIYRKFRSIMMDAVDLTMKPSSIAEANADKAEILVFPNPANDVINISFQAQAKEAYSFTILDLQGRKVLEQSGTTQLGNNKMPVQVQSLLNGMYLLHISTPSAQYNQKIVLQH